MSTPTLTRAAELLDESAAGLLDYHTLDGDCGDEHEAREAHDEMLAVAADLRAMLADAPQPPASVSQWPAWQPIETAPRDGTALLLWEEASIHPFVGWWAMGGWHVSHEHVDAEGGWDGAVVVDRLIMPITHWMPLPPDPGEAAQPADSTEERAIPLADGRKFAIACRGVPNSHFAIDELLAISARLIACWNACEGVSTDDLECNPALFSALRYERDELLAKAQPADVARLVEEAHATYASPESRLRAIVVLTEQRDNLRRTLELIEHATSPDHDDGGHHEAAWELARAALAAKGGE